jgi:DNA repair protein RecO (recombination protein O)
MNRLRLYATEAIILRRMDFGEADRILTIMTPQMGKLRVIAKGVRKITSRKAGHVELFTRVRLLLARGRTFDIVSQAETIEPYRPVREDLLRSSFAHYLSELIDVFAQEGSEDTALYDLLANGLSWLAGAPDPALAARYFELRLLTLTGYRPQLFRCARTHEPIDIDSSTDRFVAFSPMEGGVLSPAAAGQSRDTFALSVDALRLLRTMQTQPFEEVITLDVTPTLHTQTEQAMRRYLQFTLERNLRSTQFLRQLEREDLSSHQEHS